MNYSEYLLACVSHQEAQDVIDDLIDKGLIYSAEVLEINAASAISDKVRLILSTLNSSYSDIENRLSKLLKRTYKLVELPTPPSLNGGDLSLPAKI
jgi:hypothetical protein